MYKTIKKLLLSAALVLSMAAAAAAAPIIHVGDTIYFSNGIGGSINGGEFGVKTSPAGAILYNTFCIEFDEHLNFTDPFKVQGINNFAWNGGTNTNAGDPLDVKTKWLFWHYTLGDLHTKGTGYVYNDALSADALQLAIWMLEDESGWQTSSPYYNLSVLPRANNLIAAATAAIANNETYGYVKAINLVSMNNGLAQDVLINPVPEPGTIVLLGAGLLGLGLYGRRRMKK